MIVLIKSNQIDDFFVIAYIYTMRKVLSFFKDRGLYINPELSNIKGGLYAKNL